MFGVSDSIRAATQRAREVVEFKPIVTSFISKLNYHNPKTKPQGDSKVCQTQSK